MNTLYSDREYELYSRNSHFDIFYKSNFIYLIIGH